MAQLPGELGRCMGSRRFVLATVPALERGREALSDLRGLLAVKLVKPPRGASERARVARGAGGLLQRGRDCGVRLVTGPAWMQSVGA